MTAQPSSESRVEWLVSGSPESLKPVFVQAAEDFRTDAYAFRADDRQTRAGLSVIQIRADATQTGGGGSVIGGIQIDPLIGGRSRVHVPANYAPTDPKWARLWHEYLSRVHAELKRLGFLAPASRFKSHDVLQTARRELDAAQDSAAYANVGNSCLGALTALANEIYACHMLHQGEDEPRGDDARSKLVYASRHYLAGRSERYRRGLAKAIEGVTEGVWDMSQPLKHKHETATREEAEAALALVTAVFEAFSFIVPPEAGPP
jgi:hypothetical protein